MLPAGNEMNGARYQNVWSRFHLHLTFSETPSRGWGQLLPLLGGSTYKSGCFRHEWVPDTKQVPLKSCPHVASVILLLVIFNSVKDKTTVEEN